jgi:hypothetical protein
VLPLFLDRLLLDYILFAAFTPNFLSAARGTLLLWHGVIIHLSVWCDGFVPHPRPVVDGRVGGDFSVLAAQRGDHHCILPFTTLYLISLYGLLHYSVVESCRVAGVLSPSITRDDPPPQVKPPSLCAMLPLFTMAYVHRLRRSC